MKKTKEIKTNKGITLVSLIIILTVILIITSTTVYVSMDRFEINEFNKLNNDIELLKDRISNYYLKYNTLPIIRDNSNVPVKYTYTELSFVKNVNDNENYFIIDLDAIEGISLNYGEKGFKNLNTSDEVYIINEETHQIYYVKGIEFNGKIYHYIKKENESEFEYITPPTTPKIKIISGTLDTENPTSENGIKQYNSDVEIEIIPGKDNTSGVEKTEYTITRTKINTNLTINTSEVIETNNISDTKLISLTKGGTYLISATTTNNKAKNAYTEMEIIIFNRYTEVEYLESTGTQYIDTEFISNQDSGYKIKFASTNEDSTSSAEGVYGSRTSSNSNSFILGVWRESDLIFTDYDKYPTRQKINWFW